LREIDVGALHGRPFSAEAVRAVSDHWFRGDLGRSFPDGESGEDVVARYAAVLAEIADVHRGETVLVVAHQVAACIALPSLARNVAVSYADRERLDHCECAELVIDDDDWALTRWGDVQHG
jgi:broad specificity phosphatase PhoE